MSIPPADTDVLESPTQIVTVGSDIPSGGSADNAASATGSARNPATVSVIEQAKGALMAVYGLTPDAAFDLLRWHSQNRNIKIRDLAAALTAALQSGGLASPATNLLLDQLLNSVERH